jgi:TRAP-type mannitol/chloroaromatic compound transport system substrate-binding protein
MVTTAALAGDLLATYDGRKPPSIKRLVAAGANSCVRSRAVLHASDKVSQELFTEVSAKNCGFKKLYDSTTLFATTSTRGIGPARRRSTPT